MRSGSEESVAAVQCGRVERGGAGGLVPLGWNPGAETDGDALVRGETPGRAVVVP